MGVPAEQRRQGARTPKPAGFSAGVDAREASWNAERQFRFGPETGLTAIEEFCPFQAIGRERRPSNPLFLGKFDF